MYATEDILLQLEDVCDNARAVKLRQKQISLVDDYQRKRNLDFQDSKGKQKFVHQVVIVIFTPESGQ